MGYSLGLILKCSVMRDRTKHCVELVMPVRQTHLEVLDEVIEDTETLCVLAVVDIGERANLGRLGCQLRLSPTSELEERVRSKLGSPTSLGVVAHLERNVVLVYPDLELLTTDNVLLRPLRVVFPDFVSLNGA